MIWWLNSGSGDISLDPMGYSHQTGTGGFCGMILQVFGDSACAADAADTADRQ